MRPPLLSLKVSGFRAFRDEASLALRPLTLLYGRNQAGKSSLLRLLPFLADSLQKDVPGIDLTSPALTGASFKELGWLGPQPAASPWLTVQTPEPNGIVFALQWTDDETVVTNRLMIGPTREPRRFAVDFDGLLSATSKSLTAQYRGTYLGSPWTGQLEFSSMIPERLPEKTEQDSLRLQEALSPLMRIQWLTANRIAEGGATRPSRCCSADGTELARQLQTRKEIIGRASDWLRQPETVGESLEIRRDSSGRWRFELRRPGREVLPLHLAGEGVRSLLPILLCACWAEEREDDSPSMLAVEEPEAHLHPLLQVALLNRLIQSASQGVPCVLETHSIYFLRAMQLAVLEGRIAADDVGLLWIDQESAGAARALQINVAQDATFDGWRPDAFEEEQALARRIIDLRWERLGRHDLPG